MKPKVNINQIKDITANARNISISGNVEKVNEIRDFVRKDGSHGRISSFNISDGTGTMRVVLWDENCLLLSQIDVGKQVKIVNVYSKINDFYKKNNIELHFGNLSKLEII